MKLAKDQIARQFSRAAATYDQAAQLQNEMAERLIAAIPANAVGELVDLGCGTGWALYQLAQTKRFKLTAIDLAPGMVEIARSRVPTATFYCCDLEETSMPENSADIVFSNAAIQWCDFSDALGEMERICRPGGHILFSTFGSNTLNELKSAWKLTGDVSDRVHDLEPFSIIESTLNNFELQHFELTSFYREMTFESIDLMLQSIKQLGATNASTTRQSGLLGTSRYRRFRQVFEQRLADCGRLTLTFECVFGTALK